MQTIFEVFAFVNMSPFETFQSFDCDKNLASLVWRAEPSPKRNSGIGQMELFQLCMLKSNSNCVQQSMKWLYSEVFPYGRAHFTWICNNTSAIHWWALLLLLTKNYIVIELIFKFCRERTTDEHSQNVGIFQSLIFHSNDA